MFLGNKCAKYWNVAEKIKQAKYKGEL